MMEKKFKILILLLGVLAFVFTGCSDDTPDNSALEKEKEEKEFREAVEQMKTEGIVQQLCHVNMLEDSTFQYEPALGKALHAITPTIYYEPVASLEEAEQAYRRIISPLNADSLANDNVELKEITQGDVHLKFEQGSSAQELAKIIVDCPRLRDVLTEIVFMPKELWPENDNESPFPFLTVWKQKSTNHIYLCVRKSEGGPGKLLSFDGGWRKDWYKNKTYFQGEFYTWIETCTDADIVSLGYCLKDSYDKLLKAFEKIPYNAQYYSTYQTLNRLIDLNKGDKSRIESFDTKATYETKYRFWYARWYYLVSTSRAGIDGDYHVGCWTNTVNYERAPWKGTPSHAIYFDSQSYWEYKVTDTEEKYAEKKIETKVASWDDELEKNWECLYIGLGF